MVYIYAGIIILIWCLLLAFQKKVYAFFDIINVELPEWLQYPEEKPVDEKSKKRPTPAPIKKDLWN